MTAADGVLGADTCRDAPPPVRPGSRAYRGTIGAEVKGYILDFSVQAGVGAIIAEDGRRYEFAGSQWRDSSFPLRGTRVDFDVRDGVAVAVYNDVLPPEVFMDPVEDQAYTHLPTHAHPYAPSGKSRSTAAVLAILLGGFGIHKFYLGAWGWGLIYLLFCWTYIPAVIGLIEGIRYLVLSDADFDYKAGAGRSAFGSVW